MSKFDQLKKLLDTYEDDLSQTYAPQWAQVTEGIKFTQEFRKLPDRLMPEHYDLLGSLIMLVQFEELLLNPAEFEVYVQSRRWQTLQGQQKIPRWGANCQFSGQPRAWRMDGDEWEVSINGGDFHPFTIKRNFSNTGTALPGVERYQLTVRLKSAGAVRQALYAHLDNNYARAKHWQLLIKEALISRLVPHGRSMSAMVQGGGGGGAGGPGIAHPFQSGGGGGVSIPGVGGHGPGSPGGQGGFGQVVVTMSFAPEEYPPEGLINLVARKYGRHIKTDADIAAWQQGPDLCDWDCQTLGELWMTYLKIKETPGFIDLYFTEPDKYRATVLCALEIHLQAWG